MRSWRYSEPAGQSKINARGNANPIISVVKKQSGLFGVVEVQQWRNQYGHSKSNELLKILCDELVTSIGQLKSNHGSQNIAVIVATTTTGMQHVESAPSVVEINYSQDQEISSCSSFVADYCGVTGPNLTVSTACTSGAKIFGVAENLIQGGWCDAAIIAASETLCRMTCQGFDSLESYSQGISHPFEASRDGINIGEGAAMFVVEKGRQGIILSGYGESSDAYHESAPDPKGTGQKKPFNVP